MASVRVDQASDPTWCRRFLVQLFADRGQKARGGAKDARIDSISANFVPKTPKITTIGLRLDCEEANHARRFWTIADIGNYVKQYIDLLLRYQNFLSMSWMPDDQPGVLSFASFTSLIARCTRKIRNEDSVTEMVRDETSPEKDQRNTEEESFSPTIRINESRHLVYNPCDRSKPRKNASVQTLDGQRLRHRKTRRKDSSKDIKTIFRTNSPSFDKRNVESEESARRQKSKRTRKSSTKGNAVEEPPTEGILHRRYIDRIKSKSVVIFRDKHDRYESKTRSNNKIYDEGSSEISRFHLGGGGEVIESPEPGFLVEDKSSEIMILGNVKKRLERDLDDYFSIDEYDLENVEEPGKTGSVLTSASLNLLREEEEGGRRSIRTSVTCTASSIRFSNLDLSQSQSSYHTTFKEQRCSPDSSIEYRTASNLSLAKGRVKRPLGSRSSDTLVETNEFHAEFFDRNSCRYSTPKLENSSKRVMESLDSGILADFSRDCVHTMSGDPFDEETNCLGGESDLLPTYDFNTDSSYSDESLNRRVDLAVERFTEKLILAERRARIKLRKLEQPMGWERKWKDRQVKELDRDPDYDDRISGISTPPFYSFSDSEIEHL